MNYIEIDKLGDFEKIINDDDLYISGNVSELEEEIYDNMWAVGFSDKMTEKLTLNILKQFLNTLIKKRTEQVREINPSLPVKFYMWFDEQAVQLRFNLISGEHKNLPFGRKVNALLEPDELLKHFISQSYKYITEGIPFELIDPNEDDDVDDDWTDVPIDVYYVEINHKKV